MATYNDRDRAIDLDFIYESTADNNSNKRPKDNPQVWSKVSASNKTAMFDTEVNTQTTATGSFTVVFKPGVNFNTLALLNLQGYEITCVVKDSISGNIVYNESRTLDGTQISSWYDYFFEEFDVRSEIIFYNIPPYSTTEVELTITASSGATVAIGHCCVGTDVDLGGTQYGLNFGIRDYSVKQSNDYGNTIFVQRPYSKRMSPVLYVPNARLNYVTKQLEKLRSTPTVYVAVPDDERFEGAIMLGFIRDWNVEVTWPDVSLISTEIEGLI